MGRVARFRDVTVDFDRFEVVRDGVVIPTQPQVFDVLRYLIDHRDRVVSKEELLDNVWGDRFVSESTLTTRIKSARQATGDDGRRQQVIQTVHGRGYRFVSPLLDAPPTPPTVAVTEPVAAPRRRLVTAPPRLIERTDLLDRLGEALLATRHGNQIVIARGEAGIGKSALVQAFVDQLGDDIAVAVASCPALRTPWPLAPLGELLAQLGDHVAGDLGSAADAAARIGRGAKHGPTVIVIDDLHWADDSTLDALTIATRATVDSPVLFVLTYRTTELTDAHPILPVLVGLRAAGATTLDVGPLSFAGMIELAGGHAGRAEHLWRRTGGNPLFATHVLDASGDELPGGVQDVVAARLGRLPPDARRAVQLMSMSPVAVELGVASALLGPSVTELAHAERNGLISVEDDAVVFRHDIVRSAVHDTVPSLERIALHRRFCEVFTSDTPVSRRLYHASEGMVSSVVAELGPAAARAAAAVGAHRQACDLYDLVLRPRIELDPELVAALTEEHAYELYLMWELGRAEIAALEAARHWSRLGDHRAEGRALALAARILLSHEPRRAMQSALRAIELLEPLGEGIEMVRALGVLATLSVNESDVQTARRHATRAREIAERHDDAVGYVNAVNTLACAAQLTDSDEWEALFHRALDLALEIDDREAAVRISHNLQLALWDHGRLHDAWEIDQRTAPIIAGVEHQAGVIAHRLAGAHIAFALGRHDEAAALLEWVAASDQAGALTEETELLAIRNRLRCGDSTAVESLMSRWSTLSSAHAPAPSDESAASERSTYLLQLLAVAVAELAFDTRDEVLARDVAGISTQAMGGRWRTYRSELAFYLHLAGAQPDSDTAFSEPFATAISGDLAAAATAFDEIGRHHEAAICRASVSNAGDVEDAASGSPSVS